MERPRHPIPEGSTIITPSSKSWVASRFILVELGGTSKRKCSHIDCGKEYSRGTSHMILKRHWSRQHNDHFSEASMRPKRNNQNNSNDSGATPKAKVSRKRQKDNNNLNSTSNLSPRKQASNKKLNNDQLNNNLNNSSGNNNTSGRYSINNNNNNNNSINLDKSAQSEVKQVSKRLKEAYSIHLTLDIFTPKKCGKTFGIITAHSLSDSLEIKSVLLEYKHLPYPDDSATIYEFLRLCLNKFSIREKIVSIASNSSPTISLALNEIDKRFKISKNYNFSTFHIKCFPQFVHQNVIEILKTQENLLESIRKVVTFANNNNITIRPMETANTNESNNGQQNNTNNNHQHQQQTTTQCLDNSTTSVITTNVINNTPKSTGLKLPYDTKNSWNTTYNMIDIFFQQRSIIEPTLLYLQNSNELINVTIDWDRLYTLIQLLKPFHEVIHKFASDNYTPVSLVAVCIPHLMDHLSSTSWAYDDLILAAHNFKMQLESYRQDFQSDTTVIAGLLDSRVKDSFVSPEGRDDAIEILRKRMESNQQKSENLILSHHRYSDDSLWSRIFKPKNHDEINEYLESPREHGYANNNAYWEAHKHVYPNLFILAKTLACVQATSVNGDRMFSAAESMEKERKVQIDNASSKELMKSWARYLEK